MSAKSNELWRQLKSMYEADHCFSWKFRRIYRQFRRQYHQEYRQPFKPELRSLLRVLSQATPPKPSKFEGRGPKDTTKP